MPFLCFNKHTNKKQKKKSPSYYSIQDQFTFPSLDTSLLPHSPKTHLRCAVCITFTCQVYHSLTQQVCVRHCSKHWGDHSGHNRQSFCSSGLTSQCKKADNKHIIDAMAVSTTEEKIQLEKQLRATQQTVRSVTYKNTGCLKSAIIHPLIYSGFNFNYYLKP